MIRTFLPMTIVEVDTSETSLRIRGRILKRSKAVSFSRSLRSSAKGAFARRRSKETVRVHIHGASIVVVWDWISLPTLI